MLKNGLSTQERKEVEFYLSRNYIDPNKFIRASLDNESSPILSDYSDMLSFELRLGFLNRVPVNLILQTYLGVAMKRENTDAVDLLLQYGAVPYPSIEAFLCYFDFSDSVFKILDRMGRSIQLDEWDRGMLQRSVTTYRRTYPKGRVKLDSLLVYNGYTNEEIGLPVLNP
jgi:hypothetical protein